MANRVQSMGDIPVKFNAQDMDTTIAKLLECPVCLEVMTPPITLCSGGHAVCNECRKAVKTCPTCRGQFTEMRCRFAENFLDNCLVRCKYYESGCQAGVSGGELAKHYKSCDYRPLACPCPRCNKEIPYDKFLEHLRKEEKLVAQKINFSQSECCTRFEKIKREGTNPIWIQAHDRDFFCFLNPNLNYSIPNSWILWVGLFGTVAESQNYVCSITIWNKAQKTELKYVGKIYSLRTLKKDVMDGGHRLLLLDTDLMRFLNKDGMDVIIRIDKEYTGPRSGTTAAEAPNPGPGVVPRVPFFTPKPAVPIVPSSPLDSPIPPVSLPQSLLEPPRPVANNERTNERIVSATPFIPTREKVNPTKNQVAHFSISISSAIPSSNVQIWQQVRTTSPKIIPFRHT